MNRAVFIYYEGKLTATLLIENKEESFIIFPSGKRRRKGKIFAKTNFRVKYDPSTLKEELRKIEREAKKMEDEIDDELIWEASKGEMSLDEISHIYFGEVISDERKVALFRKLSNSIFFKRKGEKFQKRGKEEIERIMAKEKAQEKKRREIEEFTSFLKGEGEKSESVNRILSIIKSYVIEDGNISEKKLVESLMETLGVKRIEDLIGILAEIGEWEVEDDPLMLKLKIGRPFKAKNIEEAMEVEAHDEGRENYGETIAIDDEDTIEVDDSLSIEEEGEDFVIGIHVADIASFLPEGSGLDNEALKRTQTIYLPKGRYFMLPAELVVQRYSLSEARPSRALSLFLKVNRDFRILRWEFKRTMISVKRRTYENSLDIFQREGKFLLDFLNERRKRRKERGALMVNLPEVEIKVEGSQIEIELKEFNTIPHKVVQEAMILYNEKAAEFLAREGIPAIYRTQPFEPQERPQVNENDPLFPVKIIPYLKSSQLTSQPQPNLSLGVNLYVQASSPLRRYGDLAMQRQMLKAMGLERGKTRESNELLSVFQRIEEKSRLIKELVKSRKTYWIMKYLATKEGEHIEGYYSRLKNGRHMVFFPNFMLELPVSLPWKNPQREGRKMMFRIGKIETKMKRPILTFIA